jgi:hypothetical protein
VPEAQRWGVVCDLEGGFVFNKGVKKKNEY